MGVEDEPSKRGMLSQKILLLLIGTSCVLNASPKEQIPLLLTAAPETQVRQLLEDEQVVQRDGHI